MNLWPVITMLIMDLVWITLVMGPMYRVMIQQIQGSPMIVRYIPAIVTYILMIIGYYRFVSASSALDAFLFGIILYGVYDFTAMAVIKKWDITTAIIDVIWGGVLYWLTYQSDKLFMH